MAQKLEEFIDNWQVNVREKSAVHKSGLKFKYIANTGSIDGNEKIEMSGVDKWINTCKSQGLQGNEIFNLQKKLHTEFVQIYQSTMDLNRFKNYSQTDYSR